MLKLVFKNVLRRPLRSFLTSAGVAIAVAVLLLIDQVAASYRNQLLRELNSMGIHMMVVPLGCPYDAAARILKGNVLETSLPETSLTVVRSDKDIEVAAPLLIAAIPNHDQGRTDMFVGLDEHGIALKSWWKAAQGSDRFASSNSVILGADAAQIEMRQAGDAFYSPETDRSFKVAGVLERSGTSDDSLFFIPLPTAQSMFGSSNRLTAVAIRLRDPSKLSEVASRLQDLPGAQVVTQTEMMGTFLNILGTVRTLLHSVGLVALFASAAGLVNALLMSVAERAFEFSLFRAIGASRFQLFNVVAAESLLLTTIGVLGGLAACFLLGRVTLRFFGHLLPFLASTTFSLRPISLLVAIFLVVPFAVLASLFPAWRASQVEPAQVLKGVD